MRQNRFFGKFDLTQKSLQITNRDFWHQVKNVLRLGEGEEIILVDERGQEATAKITEHGNNSIAVEILEVKLNQNESSRRVILYCSILKRENFELVAQKATEVGVNEIVPIICEHTVKTGLKYERLQKVIKEAAEQSGRGILPILHELINFSQAVKQAQQNDRNFLFDLAGEKFTQSECVHLRQKTIGIFIGPEGGWSDFEIDLARQRGFVITSLGKLTLRAETAAIVAGFLASQDFR